MSLLDLFRKAFSGAGILPPDSPIVAEPVPEPAPAPAPVSAPSDPGRPQVSLSKYDLKKGKAALALSDFCVVDTETTGRSSYDKIVEISIIKVSGGAVVDEYSTLVNPERSISAQAEAVNHITAAMVADAPKYPDVAPRVAALLDGAVVIGQRVNFDLGFIARMLEACGLGASISWFDTVDFAHFAVPGLENYKLQTLLAHFGIDPGQAHRAADDARATLAMFERCREEYARAVAEKAAATKAAKLQADADRRAAYQGSPLLDKVFVFTGEFQMGREEAEAAARGVGIVIKNSVSGKTDFLVVGDISGLGVAMKKTKADELIAAGKPLREIDEGEFVSMIDDARRVLDGVGRE